MNRQSLWVGWIDKCTVLDVWDLIVGHSPGEHVLITSLDSNNDVAGISAMAELREKHQCKALPVGSGILFDQDCFTALRGHGANFFTGYDEIWWPQSESVTPKPETFRLTSETPISDGPEPGLGRWMHEAGIRLGLGDGYGVNVATFEDWIVSKLRETYGDSVHPTDGIASW
jgi:hypothetical protein